MNENIKVTENPPHFMVLDAISRGAEDADKIAGVTKISKDDVEVILNDLEFERLIVTALKKKKRSLFGNRNVQWVRISDTGKRLLTLKKQELEAKVRDLNPMYRNEDRQGIQSFMDSNRAWLPMMLFSGIMSSMVFASMMSFMGMAMSPAEAAMANDAANADMHDGTATADTESAVVDDNNGMSNAYGIDSGSTANSGFDLGGDFGGDYSF